MDDYDTSGDRCSRHLSKVVVEVFQWCLLELFPFFLDFCLPLVPPLLARGQILLPVGDRSLKKCVKNLKGRRNLLGFFLCEVWWRRQFLDADEFVLWLDIFP